MLPIWVFLLFAVLLFTIVYLLWRLKSCKCAVYEKFETADSADATDAKEEDTTDNDNDNDKEADVETTKSTTKVVEEEVDVESAPESKGKKNTEKNTEKKKETETEKEKDSEKKPIEEETKPKTSDTNSMNYGEMKLFDNLRENTYSLQDIKRMIREGEITEKMIEKFLARVETMENRSSSGKRADASIEGFSGNRYANAMFS